MAKNELSCGEGRDRRCEPTMSRCRRRSGRAEARPEMCQAEARPWRCAELRRGCRDVPSCGGDEAVVSRAVARMRPEWAELEEKPIGHGAI